VSVWVCVGFVERKGGMWGFGIGFVCWVAGVWVGREESSWNDELNDEELYL